MLIIFFLKAVMIYVVVKYISFMLNFILIAVIPKSMRQVLLEKKKYVLNA